MPTQNKYMMIAYDMDNTLIDGNSAYVAYIWEPTLRHFKPDLSSQETIKIQQIFSGKTVEEANRAFIKEYNLNCTAEEFARVRQMVRKDFKFEELHLFSGIIDLLQDVRKTGSRQIVITNARKSSSENILGANGVLSYFEEVYSCADIGHPKPDPYVISEVINKTNIDKSRFVYVGDNDIDKEFAQNAHIDYFQVNHSKGSYNEIQRLKQFISIS